MLTCCVLRDALERACIAFSEVLNGYLLADLVRPRNRLWTMLAIPPVRNPSGAFHALRSRKSKEIDRDGMSTNKPRPKPISRGPPFAGARKKARKCRLHLLLLRSKRSRLTAGSPASDKCRTDLAAQSWAVIRGLRPSTRGTGNDGRRK